MHAVGLEPKILLEQLLGAENIEDVLIPALQKINKTKEDWESFVKRNYETCRDVKNASMENWKITLTDLKSFFNHHLLYTNLCLNIITIAGNQMGLKNEAGRMPDHLLENEGEATPLNEPITSGITKILDSEKKKIYRIHGRVWVQDIINSPNYDNFNNYRSAIQYGASSNCEYNTKPGRDGKITCISIKSEEIYYPDEDRIVDRQIFLVKASNETLYYQEHHCDIKRKLSCFVEEGLLEKEFVDLFF